jgi:hypothetical protein
MNWDRMPCHNDQDWGQLRGSMERPIENRPFERYRKRRLFSWRGIESSDNARHRPKW